MFTLALSSILAYLDLMNGYNEDNLFDAINSGGSLSLNGYGKLFIFDQMITHRDSFPRKTIGNVLLGQKDQDTVAPIVSFDVQS